MGLCLGTLWGPRRGRVLVWTRYPSISSHAIPVQGFLARQKTPAPGTLQEDYAYGPLAVLGEAYFLRSEVPL